jgi:hypothetical protein
MVQSFVTASLLVPERDDLRDLCRDHGLADAIALGVVTTSPCFE